MDNITFTCKTDLTEKLEVIMRQTDYDEDTARSKLYAFDDDHIKVIKDYHGIHEKKAPQKKSLNQEIYRQIRNKLDESMKVFNAKHDAKIMSEIDNLNNEKIEDA
jgi:hypothetical protein